MTRKDRTGKLSIPQLKSGKIKVATKIPRKTQPKRFVVSFSVVETQITHSHAVLR